MSKTLILFYSYEGNTRKIAEFLSRQLDIPCEELKPIKDMKSKGFSKYIWGGSKVIMGKKPELVTLESQVEDYDTILLGSPIWAGSFTPTIKTLLEDGKLKDKKIAYFYCHDGGPGSADRKGKAAIEIHNKFISSIDLKRVKDDYEIEKYKALKWAKQVCGL